MLSKLIYRVLGVAFFQTIYMERFILLLLLVPIYYCCWCYLLLFLVLDT
jgi:hypothetical protein